MEAENMVHSDSMSPASLGICEKLFRRWELKTSLTEGSARRSQQTLTIRLGLPGLYPTSSSASGANSPPGGDRLTAQPLSLPECPRHTAGDQMKPQQSRSSTSGLGCPGATCTDGHPYA
ncbi:hypothetical protein L3Q82_005778 [Scortum barcoo]|uniref:Uncharacterized protein n=1 Tax=Scortum barcoo TaxID=214431 RepID=A0ACB8V6T1_9TELE|nr:hypothetical protein L3Q82_005778 [Scortum barcoo]